MFKSFSFRDLVYIIAIAGSAAVLSYRVQELEKGLIAIQTGYVSSAVMDLKFAKLEVELSNNRLAFENKLLELQLQLANGRNK